MSLIEEFCGRVDRFNWAKSHLAWEKDRLQPRKIVLAGEFYDRAIKPLMAKPSSSFASYYTSKHKDARDLLKCWIASDAVQVFPVTAIMMKEDCPHYTYSEVFGKEQAAIRRMSRTMDMMSANGDNTYERQALARHNILLGKGDEYPAIHLQDALYSFEWKFKQAQKISPREWLALASDDGRTVVDFWNNVNSLKDCTVHFMDVHNLRDDDRWKGRKKPPRPKPRIIRMPDWGGVIGVPG